MPRRLRDAFRRAAILEAGSRDTMLPRCPVRQRKISPRPALPEAMLRAQSTVVFRLPRTPWVSGLPAIHYFFWAFRPPSLPFLARDSHAKLHICGGSSSAGRASVCGTECRGFNPRLPPQIAPGSVGACRASSPCKLHLLIECRGGTDPSSQRVCLPFQRVSSTRHTVWRGGEPRAYKWHEFDRSLEVGVAEGCHGTIW